MSQESLTNIRSTDFSQKIKIDRLGEIGLSFLTLSTSLNNNGLLIEAEGGARILCCDKQQGYSYPQAFSIEYCLTDAHSVSLLTPVNTYMQ